MAQDLGKGNDLVEICVAVHAYAAHASLAAGRRVRYSKDGVSAIAIQVPFELVKVCGHSVFRKSATCPSASTAAGATVGALPAP